MSGPEIIDCEQNSEAWYAARAGIPTASEFSTVLAEAKADGVLPQPIMDAMVKSGCSAEQLAAAVKAAKKKYSNASQTRRQYLYRLAGEVITEEAVQGYTNADMERGHVMEADARQSYAFMTDVEPQLVGFIRNGQKGASPDSLIGENGIAEFKSKAPHILIEVLFKDQFPPEHKAQCQGALWVAEREWIDIVCYWPRMPLFVKRAYRDEDYIRNLSSEVDRFNDELATVVERVRRYGQKEAA